MKTIKGFKQMLALLEKTATALEQISIAPSLPLFTHPRAGLSGEQYEVTAMLAQGGDPRRFTFNVLMPAGLSLNSNIQRLLMAKTGMSYVVIDKLEIDVPF